MRIANIYKIFGIAVLAAQMLGMSACSSASQPQPPEHRAVSDAININTATAAELTRIPYIGEKTAERIVAFREANGRFRRPEELLLVQGISDERFRRIRHLIRTE